jgi:hypothetical protein
VSLWRRVEPPAPRFAHPANPARRASTSAVCLRMERGEF